MAQVRTTKKRRKLAEDLYTMDDEQEMRPAQATETYLDLMFTYLLALALAGSSQVPAAPETETFNSDPTDHIVAPWDTLQAYYFRAVRAVKALPRSMQLQWLESKDSAERAAWVDGFRVNSHITVGKVIARACLERDAHWDWHAPVACAHSACWPAPGAPACLCASRGPPAPFRPHRHTYAHPHPAD